MQVPSPMQLLPLPYDGLPQQQHRIGHSAPQGLNALLSQADKRAAEERAMAKKRSAEAAGGRPLLGVLKSDFMLLPVCCILRRVQALGSRISQAVAPACCRA